MRISALGRIVLVCAAATVAVDANATHRSLVQAAANHALKLTTTLRSCLSRGNITADLFPSSPLADDHRRHNEGGRIQIMGGFVPSANIAAQAGALDPSIVAMAGATGAGTRAVPIPDVRIEPSATTGLQRAGGCH